jgi:hypothetical protein
MGRTLQLAQVMLISNPHGIIHDDITASGFLQMNTRDGKNSRRRMASSGMLRRVALVRTEVSEEFRASVIRVTSSQIIVTLMKEALRSSETSVFLQEPHGVTSRKTAFFIVTAVKTSNLT